MTLLDKIQGYFVNEFNLSPLDSVKLRYSIEVIFNDISKLIILSIIFSILNCASDFIYSVIALLSIRIFTGGLHFKTYFGCFLFTGIFFSTSILLKNNIPIESNDLILLFIFSLLTIFLFAPIPGENRPIYSSKRRLHFKLTGMTILTTHFVIAYLFTNKHPYIINSTWVFALQSIQLLMGKGVDIYEKRKIYNQKAN